MGVGIETSQKPESLDTKVKKIVEKINPFDKESRQKREAEKRAINTARISSNLSQLKDALSFDDSFDDNEDNGRGNKIDDTGDIVASVLKDIYNNGKISPEEIVRIVQGLSKENKQNLIKFYAKKPVVPTTKSKTKVGRFFSTIVGAVDGVAEEVGIGRYERDEFDNMIKAALDPESKKDSNEGKLLGSIDTLVKAKKYAELVDILQGVSPLTLGNKGKIGAGVLGTLTLLSGGLIPIVASGFFGVRRLRQGKITKIVQNPANKEILVGITSEIKKRLNDSTVSSGQKERLQEVMDVLQS